MARIVRGSKPCPGGEMVEVEVTGAYSDGRSRTDFVFLPASRRVRTREQILDALDRASRNTGRSARGQTIAPQTSKAVLEDRMEDLYADWQRWKTTREEAQARSVPAPIVTALTNRENALWALYVAAINQWRLA